MVPVQTLNKYVTLQNLYQCILHDNNVFTNYANQVMECRRGCVTALKSPELFLQECRNECVSIVIKFIAK